MDINYTPLDNPVWYSLQQTHHELGVFYKDIAFYHPDFCPFGGVFKPSEMITALSEYSKHTTDFYVVGTSPSCPPHLTVCKELICNQMVLDSPIPIIHTHTTTALGTEHHQDLFDLVNTVQPGYFKKYTCRMGQYYGIYIDNILVAVTGERMKMNQFTEVSAVVTHPDHTGNGYAKQLVAKTANAIFAQNKIPYLHVASTNIGAIRLYEKLGFRTRRQISFWQLSLTH
ncbi:GNAT family N-acetyltransferase [Aquimarina hainanensis]|uniref:GNAT family N-acetyltransferase n=1 Tax=Aquimarina hainanensis TaxID=1578017 RepID=A0ABW5NC64_9FLAO|nr:GNAT family N-acetyltransferase [Aquimarina sp. TRL1]QKX03628.1 GNAT family N-acetyltransferase [Aquimarina sp. TRL1]